MKRFAPKGSNAMLNPKYRRNMMGFRENYIHMHWFNVGSVVKMFFYELFIQTRLFRLCSVSIISNIKSLYCKQNYVFIHFYDT